MADTEEMLIPSWGYNEEGGKIFHLKEGEALPPGYWDSPAKVGQARPENGERQALVEQAEALGVEVDGRWGVQRLRDEIEEAQEAREAELRPEEPEPEYEPEPEPEAEPVG